jgi:hypothetical protein
LLHIKYKEFVDLVEELFDSEVGHFPGDDYFLIRPVETAEKYDIWYASVRSSGWKKFKLCLILYLDALGIVREISSLTDYFYISSRIGQRRRSIHAKRNNICVKLIITKTVY